MGDRVAIKARIAVGIALSIAVGAGCAHQNENRFVALDNVASTQDEWRFERTRGFKLTTEHYDIYTTIEEPRLLTSLPQAMETCYAYYQRLLPNVTPGGERMTVYIFAKRREWERFTQRRFPERAPLLLQIRNGGYSLDRIAVAQYVTHAITFPIIAHEGLHQFLELNVSNRVPAWLNEGLAVECEGQKWTMDGLREFDPWHNPARRNQLAEVLQRNEQTPLRELLRISAGHVVGGTSRGIAAYYGQVWMLQRFLSAGQDGKYAAEYQRMIDAIGSQDLDALAQAGAISGGGSISPGEGLFRAFFAEDLDTIETEYVDFMKNYALGGKRPGDDKPWWEKLGE
ncbi:MAG: hypothetical protein KDA32_01335 [Phycisphaerales bacterium]|nr:hypothetical protein [Phycisphaerales bacterium]